MIWPYIGPTGTNLILIHTVHDISKLYTTLQFRCLVLARRCFRLCRDLFLRPASCSGHLTQTPFGEPQTWPRCMTSANRSQLLDGRMPLVINEWGWCSIPTSPKECDFDIGSSASLTPVLETCKLSFPVGHMDIIPTLNFLTHFTDRHP